MWWIRICLRQGSVHQSHWSTRFYQTYCFGDSSKVALIKRLSITPLELYGTLLVTKLVPHCGKVLDIPSNPPMPGATALQLLFGREGTQPIQVIRRVPSGRKNGLIPVKSLASCSRNIKPSRLCFKGFVSCQTCQTHHVVGGSQLATSLGTRLAVFIGASGLATGRWRETLATEKHIGGC